MAEREREPCDGSTAALDGYRSVWHIAPFDALGSSRVQAGRCAMPYDDDFDDLPCFRAVQ
jgi:hypothetical protein